MKRVLLLMAVFAIACGGDRAADEAPAAAPAAASTFAASATSLAVDGRTNATPSVAASGAFVAVAWGASAGPKSDVFVAVSRDGGRTFGAPVPVESAGNANLSGESGPRVAVRPASQGDPEVTVLWPAKRDGAGSIRVARSTDGGQTFGPARALESANAPGARGWPALAVDAAGAAHAVWLDHRGLAATPGASHHHAGAAAAPAAARDGVAMAQKSGLRYASLDGSDQPAAADRELTPGVCYCCKTAFAAGPGNTLVAAWRHVYPGSLRDMAFTISRDDGRTFSAPVRVSEDGWEIDGCPDDGPAIAVDADGAAHVVWPTVVQGATPRGAIFYATTHDGKTFSPRVEVPTLGSIKPAHPQIAIGADGRIAVAWDEQAEGRRVAAVRSLARGADGRVTFGESVVDLASARAAYYPALAPIEGGFVAVWSNAGDATSIGVRTFALR